MTSIIGYTRVPFNPSCSIAPVQRLFQNSISNANRNTSKEENKRSNFHRMFSRESSGSNGIIELIVDNNNSKSPLELILPRVNKKKDYNTSLTIDLSNKRDYDHLSFDQEDMSSSYDNLEQLINSISKLAYDKTFQFTRIIELLKQLQLYQPRHRFMSSIDKQKEVITVYFPNTLCKTVDQTHSWLKTQIDIDVNDYDQWQLIGNQAEKEDCSFDGEKYFDDIHKFINQVDALIESNGRLFSQKKNQ